MNPISRRGQILLALAAAEQDHSLDNKKNTARRVQKAEQLLELLDKQLEREHGKDDVTEQVAKKKAELEREIKEKKKICEITDLLP